MSDQYYRSFNSVFDFNEGHWDFGSEDEFIEAVREAGKVDANGN